MMSSNRCVLKSLLSISCLLGATGSLRANLLNDISYQMEESESCDGEPTSVDEDIIHFEENAKHLADLKVQMGVRLLEPEAFTREFGEFDIDGFHKVLQKNDRVLVAKSAAIVRKVRPHYYSAATMISPDYIAMTMSDGVNKVIDPKLFILQQIKDFKIKKVTVQIHFASFNFATNVGMGLDEHTAHSILNRFPISLRPDVMSTGHSLEADVSYGSYGGRTVNLYYGINNRDTLIVSYKMLTIKKETMMFGPIWSRIQAEAASAFMQGSIVSLGKQRRHFAVAHTH